MKRIMRRNGRKRGRRAGFGFSMALTAGIVGMSICQIMVWAAPKNGGMASDQREAAVPAGQEAEGVTAEQTMQGFFDGDTGRQGQEQRQEKEPEDIRADQKAKEQDQEQAQSPLIAIDPGHGGMDCGCLGKNVEEKDINLQIALQLEKKLTEKGYRVLMLREKDELVGKMDRVEIANSYQADIYVSIHQNTYEGTDKSVGGIETWYDGGDISRDNERLALLVHRETVKSTGAKGRGIINSSELYVVSNTLMPACLIETGFLSNPQEENLLASSDYQEQLAEGIARGIELYFHPGIMYVPFEEAPWMLAEALVQLEAEC